MDLIEMKGAVADARWTLRQADSLAGELAELCVGRLRKGVTSYTLTKLKRELSHFNTRTRCWKNE